MNVYFIRHGHADHNAAFDKTQDRKVYRSMEYKDSHLTPKGIEQIKSITLPKFDRIYSSPIIRCIETSRLLVGEKPILYLHDGLMEIQGPYPCNWRSDLDTFMRSFKRFNLVDVKQNYSPYTDYYLTNIAETYEELEKRANDTLNHILNECKNMSNIVIVTHNDWLESLFKRKFNNGEVYCVNYPNDKNVNYII